MDVGHADVSCLCCEPPHRTYTPCTSTWICYMYTIGVPKDAINIFFDKHSPLAVPVRPVLQECIHSTFCNESNYDVLFMFLLVCLTLSVVVRWQMPCRRNPVPWDNIINGNSIGSPTSGGETNHGKIWQNLMDEMRLSWGQIESRDIRDE